MINVKHSPQITGQVYSRIACINSKTSRGAFIACVIIMHIAINVTKKCIMEVGDAACIFLGNSGLSSKSYYRYLHTRIGTEIAEYLHTQ